VVISDGTIHGEGEHNIMNLIRQTDPTDTLVLFGNDSDLYLLCAVFPADDSWIFRENMNGRQKSGYNMANITEFRKSAYQLLGGQDEDMKDLDQYLHDFIFLSSLFGNDFLPAMPSLALHNNIRAIEDIVDAYSNCKKEDPNFSVTNRLKINRKAFQKIITILQQQETGHIHSHYEFHNSPGGSDWKSRYRSNKRGRDNRGGRNRNNRRDSRSGNNYHRKRNSSDEEGNETSKKAATTTKPESETSKKQNDSTETNSTSTSKLSASAAPWVPPTTEKGEEKKEEKKSVATTTVQQSCETTEELKKVNLEKQTQQNQSSSSNLSATALPLYRSNLLNQKF